jgi:hypothetical protein
MVESASAATFLSCHVPELQLGRVLLHHLSERPGPLGDLLVEYDDFLERAVPLQAEQRLALVARREQGRGAAVPDHVGHFLGRQHDVDRIGDGAQLVDRVITDHPLPTVLGIQGDAVAERDADPVQAVGQAARVFLDFVEGEFPAVADERGLVAEALGRHGQHLAKGL